MSLLQQAPRLDAAAAAGLARDVFGIVASASPLPSERDQNFQLQTAQGDRFVLKIANAAESRALLEAQNAALDHLARELAVCPSVVRTAAGDDMAACVPPDGRQHLVRLLTWIDGEPLAHIKHHSAALLEDLGRVLGEMDRALAGFDAPALHREFHWDLAAGPRLLAERGPSLPPPLQEHVAAVRATAERDALTLWPALRRSVIHSDANDYNVIVSTAGDAEVRRQGVAGIIDFGDLVHSCTAGNLAVAIAYAVLDKPDPLAAARAVVRGYHRAHPLDRNEVAALFGFVKLRLAMSICMAAEQQPQRPGDEYLGVSQAPIARTLPRLLAIPDALAEASFSATCDFPLDVPEALRDPAGAVPPIALDPGRTIVLDLSVASPLVSSDPSQNAEPLLSARIAAACRERGATAALGRYGEPRVLYSSPLFSAAEENGERRTIHLGIDVFVPAGTPVRAPLDGVVHLAVENDAPLDYGPQIVLRHERDGVQFFTLYGHLSRESLGTAPPGRQLRAGETFAHVGAADVNGGWPPHLHFQVITDLLGLGRDFPGVCRASERDAWQRLSPDPSAFLPVPANYPDATLDIPRTVAERRACIGRNLRTGYRAPVKVVRGWMQHLFDVTGRRYLDAYNNVPHVGHSHPRVVGAVADQMQVLNTNTRYLHDLLAQFAERLTVTLPVPLEVCYFVNSGSEANELALRLARAHTGRRDLLVLDAAYHGNTTTLIDISPYKCAGPGGDGAPPWVRVLPLPDLFRGPYKKDDPAAGVKYAADAATAVSAPLCGFIAETCPSVGGQVLLPDGYLAAMYEQVRAAGGVCIADEVQTAYGRMGTHFYAFEAHGVVPDIVVLGKPIGNGYPLGAVVTTPEIANSFDNGMEFFSTFGGSTVACAAGLAVLDVVHTERLQAHALAVGERLLAGLREVQARRPLVGDVRGSGLFIGVELVADRDTLAPAAAEASYVVNRLREEGILVGTEGPSQNVLKIRPPMPFSAADADNVIGVLDRILEEL